MPACVSASLNALVPGPSTDPTLMNITLILLLKAAGSAKAPLQMVFMSGVPPPRPNPPQLPLNPARYENLSRFLNTVSNVWAPPIDRPAMARLSLPGRTRYVRSTIGTRSVNIISLKVGRASPPPPRPGPGPAPRPPAAGGAPAGGAP